MSLTATTTTRRLCWGRFVYHARVRKIFIFGFCSAPNPTKTKASKKKEAKRSERFARRSKSAKIIQIRANLENLNVFETNSRNAKPVAFCFTVWKIVARDRFSKVLCVRGCVSWISRQNPLKNMNWIRRKSSKSKKSSSPEWQLQERLRMEEEVSLSLCVFCLFFAPKMIVKHETFSQI